MQPGPRPAASRAPTDHVRSTGTRRPLPPSAPRRRGWWHGQAKSRAARPNTPRAPHTPVARRRQRSPGVAVFPRSRPRRRLARSNTALQLLDPPLGRLGVAVFVVPAPPLRGRGLPVAVRRVLPLFLAPKRGHVEVAPGIYKRLVAAVVDEVGAEHAVASLIGRADERVGAVPLVAAEVSVEVVGDGVPRDVLPAHPRLDPLDVGLRRG